jgi:glycosyltransferase involved in cell wall biosynthesis
VVGEVKRRGLGDRVRFTGKVGDDELGALYSGAGVLVFPSLYEGFGLPPLEAFAAGIPVVASNAASIPEVLGDAAILVDPRDAAAFRDAVARVLDDEELRRDLIARGRERLECFSWEDMARKTLEVYREAVHAPVAHA